MTSETAGWVIMKKRPNERRDGLVQLTLLESDMKEKQKRELEHE